MKSALLSYEDLNTILKQNADDVVLLDATFVLPNTPIDPQLMFQNKRIGHAQFFDIDEIADQSSPLPHMLPSADTFAAKVSDLGISNKDKIIIYGQTGLALGPARAWWMFRTFGHDNVFILNGSLTHWEQQGFPIITQPPSQRAETNFTACFNPDRVVSMSDLSNISAKADTPILDARPAERFSGQMSEPRAGMRSGHIPNSTNIPTGHLINGQTGGLKEKEELMEIIPDNFLNSQTSAVMTCGSGVTACVIALAFHELGKDNWRIYDGSWSEWGSSDQPVTVG